MIKEKDDKNRSNKKYDKKEKRIIESREKMKENCKVEKFLEKKVFVIEGLFAIFSGFFKKENFFIILVEGKLRKIRERGLVSKKI